MAECTHKNQINENIESQADGCKTCLAEGGSWVAVRKCMTCGYTGCCDSSAGQHARKHFEETKHPIIDANTPGDNWRWCYIDNDYI